MTSIKKRESIAFTIPNFSNLTFASESEQNEHELKVAEMVERNNCGYSWVDSYFIAFGYGTIKPFIEYMTIAPDAVSEFTGKPVTNESDYLDVIYTYYEKEKDEQDIIKAGTVRRGRKPVDPDIAHARAQEKESKSESYKAYIAACQERKMKLKELWEDYEHKKEARKLAEAFHNQAVKDAYSTYLELKRHVPQLEDF